MCLDTFQVVGWATTALEEVRRAEWNVLRQAGAARAAKRVKGLRFFCAASGSTSPWANAR